MTSKAKHKDRSHKTKGTPIFKSKSSAPLPDLMFPNYSKKKAPRDE